MLVYNCLLESVSLNKLYPVETTLFLFVGWLGFFGWFWFGVGLVGFGGFWGGFFVTFRNEFVDL